MSARSRAGGFTLLEIAVALAICGVGMVALMQIFGGSLRLEGRASRQTRAVMVARVGMDELLLRTPERLRDGCEDRPTSAEGFRMRQCVRHAEERDGVEKPENDLQISQTLRYLEVEVGWQDGNGEKTYTLKSMRMAPEDE